MTSEECRIHNQNIPALEQVRKDPNLQKELNQMYREQADDPDFKQITEESMRLGLHHLNTKHSPPPYPVGSPSQLPGPGEPGWDALLANMKSRKLQSPLNPDQIKKIIHSSLKK